MLPFLTEKYGNASSVHSFGRDARHAMEKSRETVANLMNADPEEIYFTGCGTRVGQYRTYRNDDIGTEKQKKAYHFQSRTQRNHEYRSKT